MELQELLASDLIVLRHMRGSTVFGTNTPESDIDYGGIFKTPNESWLSINEPQDEIKDERSDSSYMELRKYIKKAATANATVLESLFIPKEFILKITPVGEELIKNRKMFITKKCFYSFSHYAFEQLKKAKGQNKKANSYNVYVKEPLIDEMIQLVIEGKITRDWMNQTFCHDFTKYLEKKVKFPVENLDPSMKEMDQYKEKFSEMLPPTRESCCVWIDKSMFSFNFEYGFQSQFMPARPTPIEFDLREVGYGVSSVERMSGVYRLYKGNYAGVFRGGEVFFSSIPKENEWKDFIGLLCFNEDSFQKKLKEYKSYWEWMANKNEQRWIAPSGDDTVCNYKNMCHLCRLLMEAENIATLGEPIIRFSGDKQKFLMDVRLGKMSYDDVVIWAQEKYVSLSKLFENSNLPNELSQKKAYELYEYLVKL